MEHEAAEDYRRTEREITNRGPKWPFVLLFLFTLLRTAMSASPPSPPPPPSPPTTIMNYLVRPRPGL